jgi:hypothetical protein
MRNAHWATGAHTNRLRTGLSFFYHVPAAIMMQLEQQQLAPQRRARGSIVGQPGSMRAFIERAKSFSIVRRALTLLSIAVDYNHLVRIERFGGISPHCSVLSIAFLFETHVLPSPQRNRKGQIRRDTTLC